MDGGATCMALLGALKATVEHDARFPRHGPRHGQYASETSETFRARVVAAEVLSLMLGHSDGKVRDVLGGKGLSNELCEAAIGLLSELRQTQRMQFFLGPLHFEEWAELKQALKCAAYLACRSCDVGRPHGEQPAYPERTTRQYTLLQEDLCLCVTNPKCNPDPCRKGLAVATAYAAHLQLGLWRCGDEYWPRYGRNIEARPVSTRTRNSQRLGTFERSPPLTRADARVVARVNTRHLAHFAALHCSYEPRKWRRSSPKAPNLDSTST